jgi:hypothetical protein
MNVRSYFLASLNACQVKSHQYSAAWLTMVWMFILRRGKWSVNEIKQALFYPESDNPRPLFISSQTMKNKSVRKISDQVRLEMLRNKLRTRTPSFMPCPVEICGGLSSLECWMRIYTAATPTTAPITPPITSAFGFQFCAETIAFGCSLILYFLLPFYCQTVQKSHPVL